MIRFADFQNATEAGVPSYLQAELERARIDSANKQAKYAQRGNLMASAATAYDKFTDEDTPIRDGFSDVIAYLRGEPEAMDMVDMAGNPEGVAGAGAGVGDAAGRAGMVGGGATDMAGGGMMAGAGGSVRDSLEQSMNAVDMAGNTAGVAGAAGAEAADTAADTAGGAGLGSILGGVQGIDQLLRGDVGGAAQTGAQMYLSTLGPAGIAAGLLLGLV